MQSFSGQKGEEAKEELNLAAMSALFAEARRVEANIRAILTRNKERFWKMAPPAMMRHVYDYRKGFAAYIPDSPGDSEIPDWPFQISGFPHTLISMPKRNERLLLFYESVSPRASSEDDLEINARVFAVNLDEVIEVGRLTKLYQQPVRSAVNSKFDAYTINPADNFNYTVTCALPLPRTARQINTVE